MVNEILVENHIASVTGDACMLEPENYGTRIAFVVYGGKSNYDGYQKNKLTTSSDEIEFIKQNTPLMLSSVNLLKKWVGYTRSD